MLLLLVLLQVSEATSPAPVPKTVLPNGNTRVELHDGQIEERGASAPESIAGLLGWASIDYVRLTTWPSGSAWARIDVANASEPCLDLVETIRRGGVQVALEPTGKPARLLHLDGDTPLWIVTIPGTGAAWIFDRPIEEVAPHLYARELVAACPSNPNGTLGRAPIAGPLPQVQWFGERCAGGLRAKGALDAWKEQRASAGSVVDEQEVLLIDGYEATLTRPDVRGAVTMQMGHLHLPQCSLSRLKYDAPER